MTDKEFLHQLRRGIGSAIIELRQNDNREKYKETVYRCCLKDIGYDNQFCRSGIVNAMGKNGVLTDEILLECQYDSYDETRKYASRFIKQRELEC